MNHCRLCDLLLATGAAVLLLLMPLSAWGQAAEATLAFEVASVKPVRGEWVWNFRTTPNSITFGGATLGRLIRYAYKLQNQSQTSGPSWMESGPDVVRFDVTAKTDRAVTTDELRLMLRALLAERWKLVLHRETRGVQVWVLSTDKNGPKFSESRAAGESRRDLTETSQGYRYERFSMQQLADEMSDFADGLVLNETGLKGRYDFNLDFLQYDYGHSAGRSDYGPALAVGVRKVGLKLEQQRRPVEVVVVDSAEKNPAEN